MRRKTPTKIDRLMTALYETHYTSLTARLGRMIGAQGDDLVSQLGEKLLRHPDLWDGNEERIYGFLWSSLYRLALNRLRDERKHLFECDSAAGEMQVEWKVWKDPSDSPEQIAIEDIYIGQLRAKIVEGDSIARQRECSYAHVFDLMLLGHNGKGIGYEMSINSNTAHGAIRRVREEVEREERSEGPRGA